jgi:hypothetical protein
MQGVSVNAVCFHDHDTGQRSLTGGSLERESSRQWHTAQRLGVFQVWRDDAYLSMAAERHVAQPMPRGYGPVLHKGPVA